MKKQFPLVILFVILLNSRPCYAQDSLASFIDHLMTKELKADEPGGVVMVARKGAIVYSRAFGMAQMELGVPMKDNMIFRIASNTKQFTAVCVLQLVAQGKLSLQDTLGKFVPCAWPVSAITIRQLLSQTSGLTGEDSISMHSKLGFAPGSKWEYNNANYGVLGRIIEKVSGLSYAAYVDKNIFKPAGMMNSFMGTGLSIVKNRVGLYVNDKQGIKNIKFTTADHYYAAGGIESNAEDLFKWNQALKSGKLISLQTLKMAFTPQVLSNGDTTAYGFGWRVGELHGSPMIWHGGLVTGCASQTLYFPREDAYVVILLNVETDKIPFFELGRIIGGMAIDKPYRFTEIAINKNVLQQYAGSYQSGDEPLHITVEEGKLCFQRAGRNKYQIRYAGDDEFFFDTGYARVQFNRDAAGQVNSLILSKADIMRSKWVKTRP